MAYAFAMMPQIQSLIKRMDLLERRLGAIDTKVKIILGIILINIVLTVLVAF
jgi:hypothetical protein